MRCRPASLLICALVGVMLPACGDPQIDTQPLRRVDAPVVDAPVVEDPGSEPTDEGPTLHGHATPPSDRSPPRPDSAARATVDSEARITIPDGASWGSVTEALVESASLRRPRGRVDNNAATLVPLPGLAGYVVIGRVPTRGDLSLTLRLVGTERNAATRVDAGGARWATKQGCDFDVHLQADGWSVPLWQGALQRLKFLGGASEPAVRVQVDRRVPAAVVLRFLSAVADAGFGAPSINTHARRMVDDPIDKALRWLAAHQLPSGAWNDALANAYCDGLRMEIVPLPQAPPEASNAALTGLVLCAFLGAGYTNRGKHPFTKVVSRGLRYVKARQSPEGVFRSNDEWTEAAGHGWATLALLMAYDQTESPIYKAPVQAALDALEATWRTSGDDPLATALTTMCFRKGQRSNRHAKRRGKPLPFTLEPSLGQALREDALTLADAEGGIRAAAGLISRLLLCDAPRGHPGLGSGVRALVASVNAVGKRADPGLTWMATQAAWHVGGKLGWEPMRSFLAAKIIDQGRSGGHVCCLQGSWDPQTAPSMPGGRVAATALRTLTFEVFYRYDKALLAR